MVGGGATGIELAAELAETFPDKPVKLSTRSVFGAGVNATSQKKVRHEALANWRRKKITLQHCY